MDLLNSVTTMQRFGYFHVKMIFLIPNLILNYEPFTLVLHIMYTFHVENTQCMKCKLFYVSILLKRHPSLVPWQRQLYSVSGDIPRDND